MKSKYTILIILMLSVLYSCTDDTIPSAAKNEGSPVMLNLNLAYPESKSLDIETRASLSTSVYDFYLFIFDAKGNLKDKYYFPTTTTGTNSHGDYSSNAEATLAPTTDASGKLSNIATTSGNSYILGVANINLKVGNSILDALKDITTMDGLKKCLAVEPTINPSVFTMSGYYSPDNNVSTDGLVEIPTESEALTGYIHLIPVDAHITFEVQAGTVSDRDFTFSLDSWQVVNVPKNVHLFHTGLESGENFYNSETSVQVTKETPTSGKTKYLFDFFVQERLSNATVDIENYGDRAAWTLDTQNKVDNKDFTNAPDNATYVILKGRYKGKSPIQTIDSEPGTTTVEEVDANVIYTIFLGEDSHTNYDSFTTNRNVNYTYKVTVNGVKDISVEVRTNKEERPDGEGEIILSQGKSYDFDAHYGAIVLEFNKTEIETAIKSGRTGYTVVTPYGNKIYVYDNKTDDDEQAPFAEWVKFFRGTNVVSNTHYPKTFHQDNLGSDLSNLMSIKDLLDELNTGIAETGESIYSDGKVRYTAYIDEFYYDKKPGTTNTAASWKDFVNVDNRKLMILANTELSDDKNSSITSAVYVINQKSIKTIYNKDAGGLSRAWGLESIEEPLETNGRTTLTHGSATIYDYNQSSIYGRKNALYTQEQNSRNLTWGNMIANTGYLSNNYNQNIYAACMLRNRDLNGNGTVEADEIRWYVPTLFQYQQMYIGMYGIEDLDARLYYKEAVEDIEWEYKHYISSNDRQIMWAEEGLSNSDYNPNGSHTGRTWSGTFTDNLRIRCVRDLGTKIDEADKTNNWNNVEHGFQDFYTVKDNNVIELTYLNRASVRTNLENKEVTGHVTTFSSNNRPALRFQYATTNLRSNNETSFDYYDQNTMVDNGGNSACSSLGLGWRLPTLTELNLMRQVGQTFSTDGNTMCRTKFEFYEWNDQNTNMGIPDNSLATSGSGNNLRYYGRYWHMWGTQDGWNPRRFMLTEYAPYGATNKDGNAKDELKAYIRCVKDAAQ